VTKIAQGILKKLKYNRAELSIQLVGDREIKSLNRQYRGINRITDVLAFPQREGRFKKVNPELLGDIVISLPRAKIQAKRLGHSFKKEVAILIIHGVLHLLGFTDDSDKKRKEMFRRQKQLMNWLEEKTLI